MWIETHQEFTERHGEYVTNAAGWRIFRDGAILEVDPDFGLSTLAGRAPIRREPPADEFDRLRVERTFWKLKLDQEQTAYNRFHATIQDQAQNALEYPESCPPPRDDAEEQLARGRSRIAAYQAALQRIDALLDTSPDAVNRAAAKQREDADRQERQERLHRIQSLSL
jgi:hypothetical protein